MRKLILTGSALFLLAGCAGQPAKPAQAAGNSAPSGKPLITQSRVFFPDTAGDFELFQKYAYPDAPDGVQITYTSKTLPKAKLDIFVFALGRSPVDQAITMGDQRMRGEVQAATKAGLYQNLQFTDDADFQIPVAKGTALPGRRLRMTLIAGGHNMLSAGYMFYKQLYLVEVRITAPAEAGDTFTQVGDDAARTLVPLIRLQNEGGCQDVTIHWDGKDPNGLLNAMSKSLEQTESDGCPGPKQLQIKPNPGEDMELITYKPEDWQQ